MLALPESGLPHLLQTARLALTLGLIKAQMPPLLMGLTDQLPRLAVVIRQHLGGLEGLLRPVLASQSIQVVPGVHLALMLELPGLVVGLLALG